MRLQEGEELATPKETVDLVKRDLLELNERQYWLWVARPVVYLDEDGNDREDLDPNSGVDSDGWWTCHKNTKKGDLVLLWRTSPKKDIGYLIQAESDAYSIVDDNDQGWDYGCDYQVLYKFDRPVNVKDLRNDPYFDEWGALRCSFQRSSFKISLEYWNRLNQLSAANNPGYLDFIEGIQKIPIAEGIRLEEELEEALVTNLKILKNFGHNLNLYFDPTSNQSGRQFICKGNGGRIDLLCCDRTQKRYVVIELKNVRAGQNTFGQISNYMGWVQNRIAGDVPVIGIVISRGYDTKFESALRITDRISHINVEDLGFAITPSKRPQEFIEPKQKESIIDAAKLRTRSINSREAGSWLKKGNTFFDQAKYDDAVPCYDKAIEKDPRNKWGLINKGAALVELAKYDEALECYDKAIELYPKLAQTWCNKGFAFNGLNKFEDAIVAFDKALEIKPKFADAWNGKGIVLGNMGRYDEAIQAYNKATTIRPKFTLAWDNKGVTFGDQGNYDDAIKAFDKAIELDSKDATSRNGKGAALAAQGNYRESIKYYDKAIELDPKFALPWCNKGDALYDLGKYEEAVKAYDEAIKLGPPEGWAAIVWNNKGSAFHKLIKYGEAIKAYEKAIELDPKSAWTWFNRGDTFCDLGKYDEAIQAYDRAIELDPQLVLAWTNKGTAFYKKGNYVEAMHAYDKAIQLDPQKAEGWYNKGSTLGHQGKYDDALKAYNKAIELNPRWADAWYNKGESLKALGHSTEAKAAFAKAKELGYKDES